MPVCDVPCQDVFRCSSVNHQEFGSGILDFISLPLERRASVYVSEVQKNVYTLGTQLRDMFLLCFCVIILIILLICHQFREVTTLKQYFMGEC